MPSIRRTSTPAKRHTSVLALPVVAWAVAGAAWVAPATAQAHANAEPPPQASRDTLLARVAAVRAALQVEARQDDAAPATEPPLLTAQATTWTNWPKWSKWSNWANK
jgi:hypothetical protein